MVPGTFETESKSGTSVSDASGADATGAVVEVTTASGARLELGPLREDDVEALFQIFEEVVETRSGYPQAPPLTREVFEATWLHVTAVVGARREGVLVGAYYLKPNFPGRGAHVANAGYVVDSARRGEGAGRALVVDSIRRAPLLGFDAVQFNLVVASNPARRLYESLGWVQIGTVPAALDGEDCIIYWRAV